jgi:hypothetical protein
MAVPSDEALRAAIREILGSSNLTEMTPKLLRRQLEQKLARGEGEFDEETIKAKITGIMNEEVEALGLPEDAGDQEEEEERPKVRKAAKPVAAAPPKRSRSGSARRAKKGSDEEDEEEISEEDEEEEEHFESDDEDKPKRKRRPPPPRPKKPALQRNPEKNAEIERLKKIVRAAGLRVKGVVEDDDETIRNLADILTENGLGTRPSKDKVRDFKKKRDIERETLELNTRNIIGDLNRRATRGKRVSYMDVEASEEELEEEEGGEAPAEGAKAEGGEAGAAPAAAASEEKPAKKQRKEEEGDQPEDEDDFNPEEEGEEED